MKRYTQPFTALGALLLTILLAIILAGCGGETVTTTSTTKQGEKTGSTTSTIKPGEGEMIIVSSAFENNGIIPVKYANLGVPGGKNISPPLTWRNAPDGAKSFAVSMVDISANNWVHWLVINIPASATGLTEGASGESMPAGSLELVNTFGSKGYGGPQPPSGSGEHVYVTTVYALNAAKVSMPERLPYSRFMEALDGKIVDQGSIRGLFGQ